MSVEKYSEEKKHYDIQHDKMRKKKVFYDNLRKERVKNWCLKFENRDIVSQLGSMKSVESSVSQGHSNSQGQAHRQTASLPSSSNKSDTSYNSSNNGSGNGSVSGSGNGSGSGSYNGSIGSTVAGNMSNTPGRAGIIVEISIKITYSRPALLFGWTVDKAYMEKNWKVYSGTNKVSYYNNILEERSEDPFFYSPDENQAVGKIQSKYKIYKTLQKIKSDLQKESVQNVIAKTIDKCKRIGSIGYQTEGLTALQLLCRAGCYNVADAVESFYRFKYPANSNSNTNSNTRMGTGMGTGTGGKGGKGGGGKNGNGNGNNNGDNQNSNSPHNSPNSNIIRKNSSSDVMRSKKDVVSVDSRPKSRATTATLTYEKAMSRLTLDQILSLPQSKYDTIGVKDAGCVRSLRDLQTWWSKSTPGSRAVSLNLINYYSSPSDTRTLGQCILDSQDALVDRFIKTFPSGQSRTREACKALSSSLYPISRRQLDCYIKKYGDKVDLARVSE